MAFDLNYIIDFAFSSSGLGSVDERHFIAQRVHHPLSGALSQSIPPIYVNCKEIGASANPANLRLQTLYSQVMSTEVIDDVKVGILVVLLQITFYKKSSSNLSSPSN
jgi:hypothetical protein